MTVVAANVTLAPPAGVEVVPVGTAAELADACRHAFDDCDVLLMAAAVADFRPAEPVGRKLKKTDPETPRVLELSATEDVLSGLAARRRPGQLLVGFAAEHGEGALDYGALEARAQGTRRGRRQRHLTSRHRLRRAPTMRS